MRDRFHMPCKCASKLSSCNLQSELHAKKAHNEDESIFGVVSKPSSREIACSFIRAIAKKSFAQISFKSNVNFKMWCVAKSEYLQECNELEKKTSKKMMHFERIINCHLSSSPERVCVCGLLSENLCIDGKRRKWLLLFYSSFRS